MDINSTIRHALLAFSFLVTGVSFASAQLTVAVQMDPNPSPYLSDWRSNPNSIRLIIVNASSTVKDVRVSVLIQGDVRGKVAETKLDAAVPPVSLQPGTTILNAIDAHVIDEGAVRYIGSARAEAIRSGRLPEDRYQLCIRLVDYQAPHAPLSQEMCASFQILLVQPPELISPPNNGFATLAPSYQWSIVSPGARSMVRYELTLIELDPGQNNIAAAFQTNVPLLVKETTIPMCPYSPSDPPLQPGRRYAWGVRAFDPNDRLTFANNGNSSIWTFTYGAQPMVMDSIALRSDKRSIKAKEAIGAVDHFKEMVTEFMQPDTLIAGTFKIIVESCDESSTSTMKTLPSGIGRVHFTCGNPVYRRLRSKSGAGMFTAVEKPDGQQTQTVVPKADTSSGMSLLENTVKESMSELAVVALPDNGLRVAFHDVPWNGPTAPSVVLDQGIATYPTSPALPPVPAVIAVDSGFTLAIETLVITPLDATVTGVLHLPESIISQDICTPARIGLPPTIITSHCELYQVVPDSSFGPWYIGETDIVVKGKGYIIDFSSTQSPPEPGPSQTNSWKGVDLLNGVTMAATDSVISNRGYVKAPYDFTQALLTNNGLSATLRPTAPFRFRTLDPFGYLVALQGNHGADYLLLHNSAVTDGLFNNGSIALPLRAVRSEANTQLSVVYTKLAVQFDMDLFAQVILPGGSTLAWGEFVHTANEPKFYQLSCKEDVPGQFYIAARFMPPYFPLEDTTFITPDVDLSNFSSIAETEERQGVTLKGAGGIQYRIWTPDVKDPKIGVVVEENVAKNFWMNIVADGVHAEIALHRETPFTLRLGPIWQKASYVGGQTFRLRFADPDEKNGPVMNTRFVSSTVWDSDWRGSIEFQSPVDDTIPISRLMFTSTADCAGGQLDLAMPADMKYWGVQLTAKNPKKSAGVVCIKRGVVYMTAAGFHEPVHFALPFNLIWGELKANANFGRLFFDYNNAGQTFDNFPYTQSSILLSEYSITSDDSYIQTCGSLSVGFFGAKQITIADYISPIMAAPAHGRSIKLTPAQDGGCGDSELHWSRDWSAALGKFAFDMEYDTSAQTGFVGQGIASIEGVGGDMSATIVVRSDRSCVCIADPGTHSISLGYVSSFGNIGKVWGCGCIVGESLESFVVGGELQTTSSGGSGLAARGAGIVAVKYAVRPGWRRFTTSGDMNLAIGTGTGDIEISGSVDMLQDSQAGNCIGTLKGDVTFQDFSSAVSGSGEFEWVFGSAHQSLQGRVAVGIFGNLSAATECGLFIGIDAPKNKAWVLDDIDGHFGLNKDGLPENLTGFYGYLSFSSSVNLYSISGGYKVYSGLGAFANFGSSESLVNGLGVLGNVGVHVWGEILAGFASAEGWTNMQMIMGVPPSFHGKLGLEACVLWAFCESVTLDCGFNINDGFYLK